MVMRLMFRDTARRPSQGGAPHDLGASVGQGTAKLGAPVIYVVDPEQFQGAEDAPVSAIMHCPASADSRRDRLLSLGTEGLHLGRLPLYGDRAG